MSDVRKSIHTPSSLILGIAIHVAPHLGYATGNTPMRPWERPREIELLPAALTGTRTPVCPVL